MKVGLLIKISENVVNTFEKKKKLQRIWGAIKDENQWQIKYNNGLYRVRKEANTRLKWRSSPVYRILTNTKMGASTRKSTDICIHDDDDDDEVRQVSKTPGDPCRCNRQHSRRSGFLLPSPWI